MGIDFLSNEVNSKDFNECYFRFHELLEFGSLSEMAKNMVAIKIASDFYNEEYTPRVMALAEEMYFRTTGNYLRESATIKEEPKPQKTKVVEGNNPFHRYRI